MIERFIAISMLEGHDAQSLFPKMSAPASISAEPREPSSEERPQSVDNLDKGLSSDRTTTREVDGASPVQISDVSHTEIGILDLGDAFTEMKGGLPAAPVASPVEVAPTLPSQINPIVLAIGQLDPDVDPMVKPYPSMLGSRLSELEYQGRFEIDGVNLEVRASRISVPGGQYEGTYQAWQRADHNHRWLKFINEELEQQIFEAFYAAHERCISRREELLRLFLEAELSKSIEDGSLVLTPSSGPINGTTCWSGSKQINERYLVHVDLSYRPRIHFDPDGAPKASMRVWIDGNHRTENTTGLGEDGNLKLAERLLRNKQENEV